VAMTMERRTFLGVVAGGLLAAPLAVEAQQAGKTASQIAIRRASAGRSSP
jgi:hypothetical protein